MKSKRNDENKIEWMKKIVHAAFHTQRTKTTRLQPMPAVSLMCMCETREKCDCVFARGLTVCRTQANASQVAIVWDAQTHSHTPMHEIYVQRRVKMVKLNEQIICKTQSSRTHRIAHNQRNTVSPILACVICTLRFPLTARWPPCIACTLHRIAIFKWPICIRNNTTTAMCCDGISVYVYIFLSLMLILPL